MTDRDALRERLDAVEEELAAGGVGPGDGIDVTVSWADYETDTDAGADLAVQYTIVMSREDAEREGREILGPADTPGGRDTVRVRPERELGE
jgi:hypothetical protein